MNTSRYPLRRETIPDGYFGGTFPGLRSRLDGMALVVRLLCAYWGINNHLDEAPNAGWPGFTHLGYATDLVELLTGRVVALSQSLGARDELVPSCFNRPRQRLDDGTEVA